MPARLPVIALLLLTAGLVAGCASSRVSQANDYVNAVNRAQSHYAATTGVLLDQISPGGPVKRQRAKLRRFYAAVDGFVAQLEAIKPPARVRSLHARLIAAMEHFGSSLRVAGAGLGSADASRVLDGQQRLAAAMSIARRTINRTMRQINSELRR